MSSFVPSVPNDSQNFLLDSKGVLVVDAIKNFELYCASFTVPTVTTSTATMDTPLTKLHFGGDKLTFEPLVIDFHVREDMSNYSTVIDWIQGVTFPTDHLDYENRAIDISRATLHVFTSQNTSNAMIHFYNLTPVQVNGFNFAATTQSAKHILCSVVFQYDYFKVESTPNA